MENVMRNDIITICELGDDSSTDQQAEKYAYLKDKYSTSTESSDTAVAGPSSTDKHGRSKAKSVGVAELKKKQKSEAAAAKEVQKQKLAEEKAAKKNANEMNKVYKPGECIKYMNVECHPVLLSLWWCSDISREVTAVGARIVPAPQLFHPALIVWTRTLPRTIDKDSGQLKLTPSVEPCNRALYVTTAEDIAEHVNGHTLASHLGEIRALVDCALTLVLFGVKEYFKTSRRKTSNSNRTPMTEIELELALTDLLVTSECDTAIVNTPSELGLLLAQLTKAVAAAPYKMAQRAGEQHAQYYMRGDSKKCVALDKDGIAVGKLWQQMVAVLPHSSLETSRAICSKFKSPLALFEALQSPDCVNELADVGVSRAGVPGSKARRVGPEFARKLKILFTAQDGNTLVD